MRYQQDRERRPARTLAGFLITILVLAGLVFGADRIAASAIQGTIEQALTIGAVATPGTTIDGAALHIDNGFPFLPQLMRGQIDEVSGSLARGGVGQFEVRDLHFDAKGVHIPSLTMADLGRRIAGRPNQLSLPVDYLEANALIPFQTIAAALTQQLAGVAPDTVNIYADGNNLIVSFELQVFDLGFITTPTVIAPRTINVQVEQVSLGGVAVRPADLPFGLGAQISTEFQIDLDLPTGAAIENLNVEPDGLRIYVSGRNVDVTRLFG